MKKVFLLCLVFLLFSSFKNELKSQTIPEINKQKFTLKNLSSDSTQKSWLKDRNRKNRISAGVGFFTDGDNSVGITLDYLRDIKNGFYAGIGSGIYSGAIEAEVRAFYDIIYSNNIIGVLPGLGLAFSQFNNDNFNLNPLVILKADAHISDLNSLGVEFKGVFTTENDVTKFNPFLSVNLGFKF